MYSIIRDLLFRFDAEDVHGFSMKTFRQICRIPGMKRLIAGFFKPKERPVKAFGLTFRNPVGLAAGFDKNASYLDLMDTLGFGHVEIGTVTPLPQAGNDKPRLFRLPHDKAIINRMGFNNDGMMAIALRLEAWRKANPGTTMIVGGNIGKNKITPNEEAWSDYVKCFQCLHPYVDYFVVNVSSPNTPGLRELQEKEALTKIFTALQIENDKLHHPKPLLLKIAPDLSESQLDDICALADEQKLAGLVATNTTISRQQLSSVSAKHAQEIGAGGLSGKPIQSRSDEVLAYLFKKTAGKIPLIGSGGIFNGADARQKLNHGASLVQVWTGFVYEGPSIVNNICKTL